MNFGKRVSIREPGPALAMQQTCVRCCGVGRIRERGDRIICKPCKGTGRVDAPTEQVSG
jgi:DnaJ-class molecular chaperone